MFTRLACCLAATLIGTFARAEPVTIYFQGQISQSTDTGVFGTPGDNLQVGVPFSGAIQYDTAFAPADSDSRAEFGRYESETINFIRATLHIGAKTFEIVDPVACCTGGVARQQLIVGNDYDNAWDTFLLDLRRYNEEKDEVVGIYAAFYDDVQPLTLTSGTYLPTLISWSSAESAGFASTMSYDVLERVSELDYQAASGVAYLTRVSTSPLPPFFSSASPPVGKARLNDTVSGDGYCILGHPTLGANCADPDEDGPLEIGDGHQYSGNLRDIAFAVDGSYYIADLNQVRKFGPDDKMILKWSTVGEPYAIAVDSQQNVWVSTRNGNIVAKYDAMGNALPGSISVGQRLSALHVDADDNILVGLDGPALGEVRKYDQAGNLVSTLYPINNPLSIATDSQGYIYVLATTGCTCSTGTILKYSPGGSLVRYVDTIARDNYQAIDIAIDSSDQLWVTTGLRRVVILDTDLNEVFSIGSAGTGLDNFQNNGQIAFTPAQEKIYISNSNATGQSVQVWGKPSPTPPVVTPVISGTLGNNGWYTSNVSVSWEADDPEWLYVTKQNCRNRSITFDGVNTFSCTAMSPDGTSSANVTIRRDATPPVTTGATLSPAPNSNGWNNTDVTVTFAGTDAGGSGIQACSSVVVSTNGANQTVSGSCADVAGNISSTNSFAGINIDKSHPSITIASPGSGTYGVGSVVNSVYTCGGAISGLESCVGPVANGSAVDTSTAGTKTFSVTASDKAGNVFTRSVSYTVSQTGDATPPTITPLISGTLGSDGWYVSDVGLTWQLADAESAVTNSSGCQARTLTSNTQGVTYTCTATSGGGTSSGSVTIKRAATAPTVNVTVPVVGATYYQGAVINAKYTCSGPPSGISTGGCVGDAASNTPLDTSTTGSRTFTVLATTNAGLTSTKVVNYTVVPDPTPPTITPTVTGTLGTDNWYRSNIAVKWAVADSESAVTNSSGCGNVTVNTNTFGVTLTCSASSSGGSSSESVTLKRDATLPQVTLTTPKNNFAYALNALVMASYACSDVDSGIAPGGCSGPVADGAPIDTSSPGLKTFTVVGIDAAGNSRAVSRTYNVQ